MNITINGSPYHSTHSDVLALLESLGMTQGRFAVEIDGTLIPKQKLAQTPLQDGMRIEVVQAVGGG